MFPLREIEADQIIPTKKMKGAAAAMTLGRDGKGSDHLSHEAAPRPVVESPDAELVARVRAGDETAFEELFDRHRRRVAIVASKFFHRREQIEEVVQETFVKAYFALESYGGGHDNSFPAWLATIATNAAYDELRRAKRRPESELTEAETLRLESSLRSAPGGAEEIERNVISRDFADKLLARLSPDDRLVLTLLNGEEASAAEVAALTGWSIAKVKVRAHRARATLRRTLAKFL